ncbi:MAG TPA: DUF58 domain-containing protein [Longimicrobiales bacterium]
MARILARWRHAWRVWVARIRPWFVAPRRLSFTRAGWLFTLGALAVGVAAIPTGNNLLFLLLGSMLGFISVSGWLSEQTIQRLHIERRVPRGVTAGTPFRIGYRIRNYKRRMPSHAVELRERQLAAPPGAIAKPAWLSALAGNATTSIRAEHVVAKRGVYPLEQLTLATGFPFGLFRKERDLSLPGMLVVWPRSDRLLREARTPGRPQRRSGALAGGTAGSRGEFRNLRDYRAGDDPRDVHWRSSARLGLPLVREYERERAEALWVCLDQRRRPGTVESAEEEAVEMAASLARAALERNQPVGLATADVVVDEGTGPAQLERILDVLARAPFHENAPAPRPPVGAANAVLVSVDGARTGGWADVFTPSTAATT